MTLVIYYVVVSLSYLVVDVVEERVANALVVGFIALLMAPACYGEYRRVRGRS